ncbi:hypothetical protein C7999DRAFT_36303 [Corynascus novoguineensis]|uniref:Vegetative cell wall protein gp1 n=1 Tax=Corynascus novoguineensis TaxID=1126955 RepID=A0AAN7HIM9_9PEZI|nr:hypothetical protein C7999DRAFT_36303 [Corynascus novoguineensis]
MYTTPWFRRPSRDFVSPRYTSNGFYGVAVSITSGKPMSSRILPQSTRRRSVFDPSDSECRPTTSRSRRNSTSAQQQQRSARPSATAHKKPPPPPAVSQATEADTKWHKIPLGYSLKNWDPTEEPIMLLSSVFDANSLGKWIYGWTVYHHGAGSPIGEMAGEMWLLLIQLAGKMKRVKETLPKIRNKDGKELLDQFIAAGERLRDNLRKLFNACEGPMLRAGTKQKKEGQLGKSAGVEFVETLFGPDHELGRTERFMASMRLWNLQFDTKCEEIL